MKVEIIMPKMGESINEGTIIKWYKKVGDEIKKDEIIYEISTDKVDTEIPAPADGILIEIKAFEQETVPINEVVAVIETNGEAAVEEIVENKEAPSTDQVGSVVELPMPKMGESVMEGTIVKWHKKIGDEVKMDEIIYEISTDKVDTEVPSPVDGVVTEILFAENETVDVGVVVAKISTKNGFVKKVEPTAELEIEETAKHIEQPKKEEVKKVKVENSNKFFSPLVLNIAAKEGVTPTELDSISGTGLSGRVSKKDILNYIKNRGTHQTTSAPELIGKSSLSGTQSVETIPMDNIRKRIMQHMIKSRDTSVHVSEIMEVDMTKIYNYVKANKDRLIKEDNVKLTYMSFITYATVRALKEYPLVNASLDGENIVMKKNINLGIAVAVEPNGLIVPNIKNADDKNVRGIAKSITEISSKARNKGLSPDDIMDGTFSITNYGVFGALFGTPIINQPEVAILGVGAVVKKPVVIEVDGIDTIGIKPMMYLSLSHDHRLVDGMLGGMFLKYIKDALQNFDVGSV
ncbi:MAG: 2-oxoglutarate dehydrogenase [Ignavibacteriae bacterium]|nr:2-oxoglutarate dehydrogenase [Ignavibacteriota bacterium]